MRPKTPTLSQAHKMIKGKNWISIGTQDKRESRIIKELDKN